MPFLCQWSSLFVSLLLEIFTESECLCPTQVIFCARIVVLPTPVPLRRVDHLVSGVLMAVVVGRVYGWPIEPQFLRDLSSVCHRPLWWWYRWWIHPLVPLWLWFPLIRGMPMQYGLLTVVSPPVGVSIGAVSLGHMCPNIHTREDCFLDLLPLH